MNWESVEGNWKQFKGNARQTWDALTEDDFNVMTGTRAELSGKLQERYGYRRERAETEINGWLLKLNMLKNDPG